MAISQVGSATSATSANVNGGSGLACNKPTGVSSGDVLIAQVTRNDTDLTAPSGWVLIDDQVAGTAGTDHFETGWWYKVAGGSEPSSYTWTKSGAGTASPMMIAIAAFSGVDTSSPIGGNSMNNYNSNQSEPLATGTCTSSGNSLTIWGRSARRSVASNSPITFTASGVTEMDDSGIWSGGTVAYSQAFYKANSTGSGNASSLGITANATETHNTTMVLTLAELVTATNADAGNVAATGTAYNPTVAVGAPAGSVSVTVAVEDTARYAKAGAATATVSAKTPAAGVGAAPSSVSVSVSVKDTARYAQAGTASATGTAETPSIPKLATAELVTVTAMAYRPTLTGTDVGAEAESVTAMVVVHGIDPHAPPETNTGVTNVYDSIVDVGPAPDTTAATGTAYDASIAIEVFTDTASGTATVSSVTITDTSSPPAPAVAVSVTVPQVSTVINGNPAQLVSATASAFNVEYIRSEVVGVASATVTVSMPHMFFGSTRVIKVAASNRTEVVAPDPGNRTIVVGTA